MPGKHKPLTERFWEKVDKTGPAPMHRPDLGRCWLWTASATSAGYGQISEGGSSKKKLAAHRISYELAHGPIPVGEGYHGTCVCHSCDNRKCVNPAHLWLGTIADDHRDKVEKGRAKGGSLSGEGNKNSKLIEEQVVEIRCDYVRGSRTNGTVALGKKYGVSNATIGRIVREESWK